MSLTSSAVHVIDVGSDIVGSDRRGQCTTGPGVLLGLDLFLAWIYSWPVWLILASLINLGLVNLILGLVDHVGQTG